MRQGVYRGATIPTARRVAIRADKTMDRDERRKNQSSPLSPLTARSKRPVSVLIRRDGLQSAQSRDCAFKPLGEAAPLATRESTSTSNGGVDPCSTKGFFETPAQWGEFCGNTPFFYMCHSLSDSHRSRSVQREHLDSPTKVLGQRSSTSVSKQALPRTRRKRWVHRPRATEYAEDPKCCRTG